jgi:DNA-binding NarL/FixJ family response regulator
LQFNRLNARHRVFGAKTDGIAVGLGDMSTLKGSEPVWWDRDFDDKGRPIRADVRAGAREVWPKAHRRARYTLADADDAATLMDSAVSQASRYLDRIGKPLFSGETAGLVMLTFTKVLRRHALRAERLKTLGTSCDMQEHAKTSGSTDALHCRLDLQKILRNVSPRSRTILALRTAGYDWEEIAKCLQISETSAKNTFWRELRRAGFKLRKPGSEATKTCRGG